MKPSIEVCLSPLLIEDFSLSGKIVVVIDVFRATSTIAQALNNGAKFVFPVKEVNTAIEFGKQFNCKIAGERNGQKIDGFDFGNSPLALTSSVVKGEKLVLTTTNGTQCIAASEEADDIICGSFVNEQAIVDFLNKEKKDTVLFCSGWKGKINIEDSLFAGSLLNEVKDEFNFEGDSELMIHDFFLNNQNLIETCKNSSHYQRLSKHGSEQDLEFCLTRNSAPVLAIIKEGKIIKG